MDIMERASEILVQRWEDYFRRLDQHLAKEYDPTQDELREEFRDAVLGDDVEGFTARRGTGMAQRQTQLAAERASKAND